MPFTCLDVANAADLGTPKQSGSEFSFHCPIHRPDNHPSLKINVKKNVFGCFPCGVKGTPWKLAAFVSGNDPADKEKVKDWLRDHGLLDNNNSQPKIIAEYVYFDADGQPSLKVLRYDPKGFCQQRWDGNAWAWKGQKPKLLYRLPELLAAPERWVLLCEGEKDADRLSSLCFLATTNPGGAGKWDQSYTKTLRGRRVAILPDNDEPGRRHALKVAGELITAARDIRIIDLPEIPEKGDVSDWLDLGRTADELKTVIKETPALDEAALQKLTESVAGEFEANRSHNPWDKAIPAPEFLARVDQEVEWLQENVLAPGAITYFFSPRGIGKSLAAHAFGIRLAKSGKRVLLADRDNPPGEVRRRLKMWGAKDAPTFKVMTRDEVPPLTDKAAWGGFPFHEYDLVIIDSLDSTAEGTGEQDSSKISKALASILDVAHRSDGPAVLVLGNTVKSGKHSRGSGVVEDRAEIVFEVRDATGLHPSGTKDWWKELPPAGNADWADRASRRQKRGHFKLAFVPSKFRIGAEPEPFILEVDLSGNPWGLRDVTDGILQQGENAINRADQEQKDRMATAATELTQEVQSRADSGDPLIKSEAEPFLMDRELRRKEARALITEHEGMLWKIRTLKDRKGHPKALVPIGQCEGGSSEGPAADKEDPQNPLLTRVSETPSSAAPMNTGRQKTGVTEPLPDKGFRDSSYSPPEDFTNPSGSSHGEPREGERWEGDVE